MFYPPVLPECLPGRPDSVDVILADHARNHVPFEIAGGNLGLPPEDMERHIAFDPGTEGVARAMGAEMGAMVLLNPVSRLVIDPNRGLDDPTLVRKIYDGSVIPANRDADAAEVAARVAAYYQPYHDAIAAAASGIEARGATPRLIAIHSFTPALKGHAPRPWEVGILWDEDARLAAPLIAALRAEGLCVGDNEPYSGRLPGDTMSQHGSTPGRPHVLIEIRNDLIATDADERAWAARLSGHLTRLGAKDLEDA